MWSNDGRVCPLVVDGGGEGREERLAVQFTHDCDRASSGTKHLESEKKISLSFSFGEQIMYSSLAGQTLFYLCVVTGAVYYYGLL